MKKRGVSPVIATILLISLVVVVGLIIFLWLKTLIGENCTKFEDKNVKQVCQEDLNFDASFSNNQLTIRNLQAPIYNFNVKTFQAGGEEKTVKINAITFSPSNWPSTGLSEGMTFTGSSNSISSSTKIRLTPILAGKCDKGKTSEYECEERYGKDIQIT